MTGRPWHRAAAGAVLLALLTLLAGCGGDDPQPEAVTWRNVTLDLPDDWWVWERTDTVLSIANADLRPTDDGAPAARAGEVVSMSFTYEPGSRPDDWRGFVEDQGATLEADNRLVLDGEVPATQLVFSYVTNDIPMREMIVLIPSRSIVVLSQPVPGPGEDDGPDIFLAYVDTFLEVLETAEFGAPQID